MIVEQPLSGSLLETKTSHKDDVLLEKFERAIQKHTALYQHHDLVEIALEHDPIDLARASTRLPISARLIVYKNLPDIDAKALFIQHATVSTRVALLRFLPDDEIKLLLERMPPDEAVSILDDLPYRRVRKSYGNS